MTKKGPQAKHPIKATKTTFDIIEALKKLDGAGVSEIADNLNLGKSNVHNYLSTLEQEGYIYQEGTQYQVGLQFLELGAHARQKRPVYEIAKPELRDLADKTGERANLLVEEQGKGSYLYHETGNQAVKVDANVGSQVHLHNTALGKAIMAHLSQEYIDKILSWYGMPKTSGNTITDRGTLENELTTIREQGVAFDYEERLKNLRCVAVPVFGKDSRIEGAISVSGPKSRFQDTYFEQELPNQLQQVSDVIELNITHG